MHPPRSGVPVRKGRIDPMPYIDKAKIARVSIKPKLFDMALAFGGKRTPTKSGPLPLFLQVSSDKLRKQRSNTKRKLRELEKMINPPPEYTVLGPFKVYK